MIFMHEQDVIICYVYPTEVQIQRFISGYEWKVHGAMACARPTCNLYGANFVLAVGSRAFAMYWDYLESFGLTRLGVRRLLRERQIPVYS